MTRHDDDRDLRARFEELRTADADLDPGYEALRAASRRPTATSTLPPGRVLAPLVAAAAAGVTLWLALPERRDPVLDPAATARFDPARWSMPSDALLDLSSLPGDALLRDVPALGRESVDPEGPSVPSADTRPRSPSKGRSLA